MRVLYGGGMAGAGLLEVDGLRLKALRGEDVGGGGGAGIALPDPGEPGGTGGCAGRSVSPVAYAGALRDRGLV